MSKYKIILFDVDDVLIIPPKLFSQQYCERFGINPRLQGKFYESKEWKDASLGKFDLKEALRLHNDKWQWHGEPDELLQMWFEGENYPNEDLFKVMKRLRKNGALVFLATQQEKYRAAYLRDVIFKDKIDGMFCSCDIGSRKSENHFWETTLSKLGVLLPDLKPYDVAYFDDNQGWVDKAKEFGVDAFLYTTVSGVSAVLA